jgi:dihydropteroate synthase
MTRRRSPVDSSASFGEAGEALEKAEGAPPQQVLFVTGKLAEPALRRVIAEMAPPFGCDVAVLKITVAALMTTSWIARALEVPEGTDLVLIPGLCEGDAQLVADAVGVRVEKGPKDLREIPRHFGARADAHEYGAWDIEIVAEINNAPRVTRDVIRREAERYRASGADIIDIGCTPGLPFPALGEVVRELREAGMRVSIDTFDAGEIATAVAAGAELVLSVNASNVQVAQELAGSGARFVVVPEPGGGLDSLEPTIARLTAWGAPFLIDPILEPIGMGFMASLERYADVRRRWPTAEMLMGIGNLTELTAADSTGVNALLIAICQELGIRAVLTTEVIPWARGAVREVDVARRLMHYAVTRHAIPKGIDDRLVTIKDPAVLTYSEQELRSLQAAITDPNYRIFADREVITVFNNERFVRGTDIQAIFAELDVDDPAHAFYLGKELARASLAVTLGKTYRQEGALSWGYLTPPDDVKSEHVRLTQRSRGRQAKDASRDADGLPEGGPYD